MRLISNFLTAIAGMTLVAGCAHIEHSPRLKVACNEEWVVLPMDNLTESPHAAESAERLTENILRSRGATQVAIYPGSLGDSLAEFGGSPQKFEKALDWARGRQAHFGITGSVAEWRYKSGMEGEPVVGMTLKIIEIGTGKCVWSAGGSKTGWDRDAVTGVAQDLIHKLLQAALPGC